MRLLLTFFLITIAQTLFAQQSILAQPGDEIKITLQDARGFIQWQESTDGMDWSDIQDAQELQLERTITSIPVFFRAAITDGTCEVFYTSHIKVQEQATSPVVLTGSVTSVTSTTATVEGNVSSDGGTQVTARGFVYGTSPNPTLDQNSIQVGNGTGSFSMNLSGLQPNTEYFVRAFATNSQGTSYGNDVSFTTSSALPTILMFVSHENTYYSEYIVMKRALEASGYSVDVRSASAMDFSIYMVPSNTNIEETANTLTGSNYAQFTGQFQNHFGQAWDASLNAMPSFGNVNGRIQDITSMDAYKALVIVGGTGALDFRVDGSYNSQGAGDRLVPAAEIQAAAEKLNALALDALAQGKPVMAQCHGASIPAFWRIPGTNGTGPESLGFSLIKDQYATGFPEPETATTLEELNVNFKVNDRVTITSPHASFDDGGKGRSKIITTRDWYPQTVAYAARTLINILNTFPSETNPTVKVLLVHGGAINTGNCSAANKANDVPCNYGGGAELPADYTHVLQLLQGNSEADDFVFNVTDINLTSSLPFDASNKDAILNYLNTFDVVVFYKHWSTGVTNALQNALVDFADGGGGVLALHHGLYNDVEGSLNKNILVEQLFKAESSMTGWSANRTTFNMYSTDYGHFVSTYGINFPDAEQSPGNWNANPLTSASNFSFSYYSVFSIYDEVYNNMTFVPGVTFGDNVNEITPIFSNNLYPETQSHTSGFVAKFDPTLDGTVGKIAFYIPGERPENFQLGNIYGQVVRNTLAWLAAE